MSTPSYSRCAMRMVRLADRRSLREASCWSVEVVKGGCGLRRVSRFSTDATAKVPWRSDSTAAVALCSFGRSNLPSFLPSRWVRRAVIFSPRGVVKTPSMVQNSCGRKDSISPSRSQIRRSATDCTRPAEREPGTLRHSTGDSVKPTR